MRSPEGLVVIDAHGCVLGCRDTFVMEYCGEVCTPEEFEQRKKDYRKDKRRHYYFMSLKTDEVCIFIFLSVCLRYLVPPSQPQILDATRKGNLSRFINHSCDPNCETQKVSS